MTIYQFPVEYYTITLGHANTASWGGTQIRARGMLVCYGGDHRFIAYFLTDDSPVAAPVYIPANKVGAIFLPFREMAPFVDLVRNEKPIYAYLNSDTPQWNSLKTGQEPVGEEEFHV
jgi:hypothetical protein